MFPQVMLAHHITPHSSTLETPNRLMLDREIRVPDHLTYHVPAPRSIHEHVEKLIDRLRTAHKILQEKHWKVHGEDSE